MMADRSSIRMRALATILPDEAEWVGDGRQEEWEDSPEGYPQTRPYKWWNWNDSYLPGAAPDPKWVAVSDAGEAAFRKDEG